MEIQNKLRIQLFLVVLKPVAVFMIGSIGMHLIVMFVDYFLLTGPIYLNLNENFSDSMFSIAMLPIVGAYGLFSLVTYSLWARMKKAMLLSQVKETKREKVEAVLNSMQRITGILAEHIAIHNSKIMGWVEFRKRQGSPVSERVEKSSKNIADVLLSLSEISFIVPYTRNRPKDIGDYEKLLQTRLLKISAFQANMPYPLDYKKNHQFNSLI